MEKIITILLISLIAYNKIFAVKPFVVDPVTNAELNVLTISEATLLNLTTKNIKKITQYKAYITTTLTQLNNIETEILESKQKTSHIVESIIASTTITILCKQIYDQIDVLQNNSLKLIQNKKLNLQSKNAIYIIKDKLIEETISETSTLSTKLSQLAKKDGQENLLNSKQRVELMYEISDDLKQLLSWITNLNNKLYFLNKFNNYNNGFKFNNNNISIANETINEFKKLKF